MCPCERERARTRAYAYVRACVSACASFVCVCVRVLAGTVKHIPFAGSIPGFFHLSIRKQFDEPQTFLGMRAVI